MLGRCRYVFAQAAHWILRRNRSQSPPSKGNKRNSTINHREFRSSHFGLLGKEFVFDVRSGNVYENKQNVDNVEWKMSDIHVEFIRTLRTFPAMCGQLRLSGRSGDRITSKLFWLISMCRSAAERERSPGNFTLEATICMKKQGLTHRTPNWPKADAIDNKRFICWSPLGGGKKEE